MVAVEAGDQQPALAHPAVGLFQSHHAAEIRRTPHRATQVGPQRRKVTQAATLAPPPPLEPPGMWSRFQGLCTAP